MRDVHYKVYKARSSSSISYGTTFIIMCTLTGHTYANTENVNSVYVSSVCDSTNHNLMLNLIENRNLYVLCSFNVCALHYTTLLVRAQYKSVCLKSDCMRQAQNVNVSFYGSDIGNDTPHTSNIRIIVYNRAT